jgi:hypothetical protein
MSGVNPLSLSAKEALFRRLPAIYRIRDAEHGDAMRALMGVLDEVREALQADMAALYENWFIETCAEWLVPYLADLVSAPLNKPVGEKGVYSQRAYVANTIGYRRRKGTPYVLESLGRDVSLWPVKAVEFWQRLEWSQNLNHLRFHPEANPVLPSTLPARPLHPQSVAQVGTFCVRDIGACDRIDSPFDTSSRSVDIRPLSQTQGRFGIRNIGLFAYRLQSYPLRGIRLRRSRDYADGFHFHPCGLPSPLFTNPRPAPADTRPGPEAFPRPLAEAEFYARIPGFYGPGPDASLALFVGALPLAAALVPTGRILCKNLKAWDAPPAGKVAIDPVLGRVAFAPGESPAEGLCGNYHYGFSGDLGGGPYLRRDGLVAPLGSDFSARVRQDGSGDFTTLSAAFAAWGASGLTRAVITVADSGSYGERLRLDLHGDQALVLQAADGERPHLRCQDAEGPGGTLDAFTFAGGAGAQCDASLNGFLIEGHLEVSAGSLRHLRLAHCALVPGRARGEDGAALFPDRPSLVFRPDAVEHRVRLERCITGPIAMEPHGGELSLCDCILDAPDGGAAIGGLGGGRGPTCDVCRVTVLGDVDCEAMALGGDSLFTGRLRCERRQTGCLRYSYVDDGKSRTPRRYRCQPEFGVESAREAGALTLLGEGLIRSRVKPRFTSRRFGRPAYAQLHLLTPVEIREGSESGVEMGAFEHLKQAHRLHNLLQRAAEYSPAGTELGVIFAS